MSINGGRIFLAESIGTAVLVLGGVGTAVLAGARVGPLGVALAFGLSLLALAYTIGPISGCHVNPAVSLGMTLAGKLPASRLGLYWVAQLLGAAIGAGLLYLVAKGAPGFSAAASGFGANGYGAHSPGGYGLFSVGLAEILMTAAFVWVVLGTTQKGFPTGFAGIAAGLMLTLVHLISIPVSNTSVNPARSFGAALFQGGWGLRQLWAFFVFPLIGGVIAAALHRVLSGERAHVELPTPRTRVPTPL
ncbi:MAG: aquaporin Z [Myxococcaceae bacterium]|nr:aquaporin Z [Myxococcaceae bacterium]